MGIETFSPRGRKEGGLLDDDVHNASLEKLELVRFTGPFLSSRRTLTC